MNDTTGDRIKFLRKRNGLKLKDLALSLGCSVSYLSELENNKKTASGSFVYQLSHVLMSSPEFILTGKEPHDLTYDEILEMIIKHGEINHLRLFYEMLLTMMVFNSQKIEYSEVALKELEEENKKKPDPSREKEIGLIRDVIQKSTRTMSIVGPLLRKIPL